jgi:hypothetical protein
MVCVEEHTKRWSLFGNPPTHRALVHLAIGHVDAHIRCIAAAGLAHRTAAVALLELAAGLAAGILNCSLSLHGEIAAGPQARRTRGPPFLACRAALHCLQGGGERLQGQIRPWPHAPPGTHSTLTYPADARQD